MTVLILTNRDVGLYRFRKELIAAMLEQGHRVVLSLPDQPLVRPLRDMGCEFIETPLDSRGVNPLNDRKLFSRYRKMLKDIRPDLVITYTVKPNVYGGIACRMARVPYVCNITGLGTAFQKKGALRALVTQLYRTALKKAGTVFFENADNPEALLRVHAVKANQIRLMPGAGVNLEEYDPAPYPADDGVTRFLFLSRVMREKGVEEFFSCAEKLKAAYGDAVVFDMVGWFDDDYSAVIGDMVRRGFITFHGYREDPWNFYDACSCLVLPSYHDGMSNVLQEAAATGRPLITTDVPGCREAVLDGKSGYLCRPQDAASLYDAMEKFHLLPYEQKQNMGAVSRRLMEQRFDRRKVVEATMKELFSK